MEMNKRFTKQCTCVNCGCTFEMLVSKNYRTRDYCSPTCRKEGLRAKYPQGTGASRAWSKEEEELLRNLHVNLHVEQIVGIWNKVKPVDAPERGRSAIRIKFKRLGISCKADFAWTATELARRLEICCDRVQKWIDNGRIETDNYGYVVILFIIALPLILINQHYLYISKRNQS